MVKGEFFKLHGSVYIYYVLIRVKNHLGAYGCQ